MTSMTTAVLISLSPALVFAVLLFLAGRRPRRNLNVPDCRMLVEMHAIRRRFDVACFKSALKRDMADARRALQAEMDEVDRQGRQR